MEIFDLRSLFRRPSLKSIRRQMQETSNLRRIIGQLIKLEGPFARFGVPKSKSTNNFGVSNHCSDSDDPDSWLSVCNPCTRQTWNLPDPPNYKYYYSAALGYDFSVKTLKVVIIGEICGYGRHEIADGMVSLVKEDDSVAI
ncbi:F-box protein [Corchorus olitorius]|uniref:F-box protein n=1 Tax=Corchorus olitorius TaxID=93759 RepID=A0A1R3G2W3_9ROSI|nr:F-box protein [Corchorus olitorius]